MKTILRDIEASLESLGGDPDERDAVILKMQNAIESLTDSPLHEEVHCILIGAATDIETTGAVLQEKNEPLPSHRFHRLREKYTEAVDHHPGLAIHIGRLADAFATLGL